MTLTIEQAIEQVALDLSKNNNHLVFSPPNDGGKVWIVWRSDELDQRFYYGRTLKTALSGMVEHDALLSQQIQSIDTEEGTLNLIEKACFTLDKGFSLKVEKSFWTLALDGGTVVVTCEGCLVAMVMFAEMLEGLVPRT